MAYANHNSQSDNLVTPIKLDQHNFTVWRYQVLASIKGNGLKAFITCDRKCPDQYLSQNDGTSSSPSTESRSQSENPAFAAWIRTDQLLMSWMFSSVQENFLASMIHCVSSQELWECLTHMFISQNQARIMPFKIQRQTSKKGSMTMNTYFSKMKRLADSLAIAGNPIETNDLINYMLAGLASHDFESLVTSLLARSDNMNLG